MSKDSLISRRALLWSAPALFVVSARSSADESSNSAIDRLIDQIVANERAVMKRLAERTPIVETYIQENLSFTDPAAETKDHYFLGRMGLKDTIQYVSFVNRQAAPPTAPETRTSTRLFFLRKTVTTQQVLEHIVYLPEGFAQMALVDTVSFDRKTYRFDYIRREFLGDVRCLVFDLSPLKNGEAGKFVGRIWVDDQTYFIARINGTYNRKLGNELFFHFDSWRVNPARGVWIPAAIYIEDAVTLDEGGQASPPAPVRFKAQTRIWSYDSPTHNRVEELTSILVDANQPIRQETDSKEISPIESQRRWEKDAENNILDRLERIGLVAPKGELDKVLDTVVNNLIVTNQLNVQASCRVLLTTPFETFTVGQTMVVSRGLIDVLPDEASLALVLATELAHIALAHPTRTEYAFNDRTMVGDEAVLERFRFARSPEEVATATQRAIALLAHSPYRDKMSNAGLFLKALQSRTHRLAHLIQPTFGNNFMAYLDMPEFHELLAKAPKLEEGKIEQIAALPLGSHVRVEPWNNQTTLIKTKSIALLSAREKMPFEITPVSVYLTRASVDPEVTTTGK